MVSIFILLLVAEYQIKIANNKLKEVLGGTDGKRQRMKRVSWPFSVGHWKGKCRREVDIPQLSHQSLALTSRKASSFSALSSSLTAAVL